MWQFQRNHQSSNLHHEQRMSFLARNWLDASCDNVEISIHSDKISPLNILLCCVTSSCPPPPPLSLIHLFQKSYHQLCLQPVLAWIFTNNLKNNVCGASLISRGLAARDKPPDLAEIDLGLSLLSFLSSLFHVCLSSLHFASPFRISSQSKWCHQVGAWTRHHQPDNAQHISLVAMRTQRAHPGLTYHPVAFPIQYKSVCTSSTW